MATLKSWRDKHGNQEGERNKGEKKEKNIDTKLEVHWPHAPPRIEMPPRCFKCCPENNRIFTRKRLTRHLNGVSVSHSLAHAT